MNDLTVKKENVSRWINTILMSILLAIMGVALSRVKELNDNTEFLQVELAIVATKFDNHIDFAQEKVRDIEQNTDDIHQLRETYVTREEIREMLDEIKRYIELNGQKNSR